MREARGDGAGVQTSAVQDREALAGWLGAVERLSGSGYFAVDADQNVVSFGAEMESLTGVRADDVVGRHCLRAFRCVDCLPGCALLERGTVGPAEIEMYRADGSTLRVVKTGHVVRDEAGRVVLGIEQVRPVAAEGSAGTDDAGGPPAARRFDQMLRALGRYFLAANREMRVVECSDELPAFLGVPRRRLLGMPLSDLLGGGYFGADSAFRAAVLAGERREGWRATVSAPGGASRTVSLTAAAIRTDEATPRVDGCRAETVVLVMLRPEPWDGGASEGGPSGDDEPLVFEGMVARSPAMRRIFRLIDLLRDNDAGVLVTGESGTGKELVARAIHARSHRSDRPFVAVNCGALPGELLESELFGHVRGAFTGAVRDRPGRFELADGGTIFLDEIGDLPLPLQVKLLRVLQEQTFERVGDPRTRTVDVRVIAATHIDLVQAINERRFRDDLYYRLRIVPIELPPLRARREDLELLVTHLLQRIGKRRGRALRLSPAAMRLLLSYAWPGNVRELENALEYATAVCEGQTIHDGDLPEEVRAGRPRASISPLPASPPPALLVPEDTAEPARIRAALEATHYRKQAAADLLGISRWTLWRKMKEHGLR